MNVSKLGKAQLQSNRNIEIETEQKQCVLATLIKSDVSYSIDELRDFVINEKNYQDCIVTFSSFIHENITSNVYVADASDDIIQAFTLLVFSAQCTMYNLLRDMTYQQDRPNMFAEFVNRQTNILDDFTLKLDLTRNILFDLFIIVANKMFINLSIHDEFNISACKELVPSTNLTFESSDGLFKYGAVDFSNENMWSGVLEYFRDGQEIVRLDGTKSVYFIRVDALQNMFGDFDVANLVYSFFTNIKNPSKVYINYGKFRENLAEICLKQIMIDTDPYGSLQWLTEACDDVELLEYEYCITHNGNTHVFKRADSLLLVLKEIESDRFKAFTSYIEHILPNIKARSEYYINMDYLNLMFDIMPVLD